MLPFLCPLEVREALLHGPRGSGKRLADRSKILTNKGWKLVGEVNYEDKLVAPDGTYTNIIDISKRKSGPLYQITFDDGATTIADEEHNWSVSKDLITWEVKSTQELLTDTAEWFIPLAKAPAGVEYRLSPTLNRKFRSIERVADGPGTCFAVDHHSHQYVCQDFIVTHNTDIIAHAFFKNVGYGANRGWGPHWRGMLFKRSIPETDTVFEKFKILFQNACPEVKYVTHPYKVFRFPGGEMFTIRQMFDIDDYQSLHGSEIPFLSFDELGNWPSPDVYLRCMSLLRSAHPEVSKHMRMWAATNPSGPGVGWIMKRFKLHDRKYDKTLIYDSSADNPELARWKDDAMVNIQSRPRISLFIDTRLNEIFMKANPTYLAEIAAQAPNDALRRAWIDGEWGVASGGMFDDVYEEKHHVVKPFRIPLSWRIDRSMDWGSDSPFAILWFAQSDGTDYQDMQGNWHSSIQGDVFVIREWYGTTGQPNKGIKLTASAVARGIVEREIEWGIHDRCYPGPADNQIHTELNAGFNIEDCMKDEIRLRDGTVVDGIEWTTSDKASGARISGWALIRERLRTVVPEEDRPFHREKPGLFFFRTLEHMLSHFPNTPRDEKKTEDVPVRGEYHLQDALRYRLLADGRGLTSGPTVGKY